MNGGRGPTWERDHGLILLSKKIQNKMDKDEPKDAMWLDGD